MRKKGLFLVLLAVFILTSLVAYNFFASQAKLAKNHSQNDLNVTEQPSSGYVNSLVIKIQDGYELTFTKNFTQAEVKITNTPLTNPASVRIFDKNGRLVTGEYTTMVEPTIDAAANNTERASSETNQNLTGKTPSPTDETLAEEGSLEAPVTPQPVQYILATESKSYTVNLEIGSTIEVTSPDLTVLSSLSGQIVPSFMPSAATETYVVMLAGLRKSTWDVKRGNAEMYGLVRDYFSTALRQYAAEMPDKVLNNKNLDTKDKSQALVAYYQLTSPDQVEFRDFIENLQRGGLPQISYTGRTEYTVGEKVDFIDLVTATDPEDGEVTKISLQTDADLQKPGNYQLTFSATDSDKNTSTLDVNIAVVDNYQNRPADPNQNDDGKGNLQNINSGVSSLYPSGITTIIKNLVNEKSLVDQQEPQQTPEDNADSTDATPEEPVQIPDDSSTKTPVQNTPTSPQTETTADENSGLKFWQIALGVVGVVVIIVLIRFISDHYIR